MKRAIFFRINPIRNKPPQPPAALPLRGWISNGIKQRIIRGIFSAVLVSAGITTPLRGLMPATVIADDNEPPYRKVEVILTAYSSSPDETDETPYITAAGTEVRDGVIANNCLAFGTKIQIPELFGDKVFVVEDRKNTSYGCEWIDLWYPSKEEAKKFGIVRGVEAVVFD